MAHRPLIHIYVRPGAQHQAEFGKAFQQGLSKHGIRAEILDNRLATDCDVAVFWSHRHKHIIEHQKARGRSYLVAEAGYFNNPEPRFHFVSLGWGGLNGRADFRNKHSPADRWQKHGGTLLPWRADGNYILIMGQVAGDAAVEDVDLKSWYGHQKLKARQCSDLRVVFRAHPKGSYPSLCNGSLPAESLTQALCYARLAITYNSNSGVDAVLAGVPTVAVDRGSMAWDVTFRDVETALASETEMPDRTQWAYDLAYCQWTHEEIANGEAWEHLWDCNA